MHFLTRQNKAKDKNYDKVLCPKCELNYKARTAIVCYQCNLEKRREGRQGPQYCYRCGSQLTKANWPTHRRKYWARVCSSCWKKDTQNRQESINKSHRKIRVEIKRETIEAYGGKCNCCGITEEAFLTIDHIDGRGKDHQKKVISKKTGIGVYRLSGTMLYKWLKKHGWPKDNYQLLCMNCNFAKSHNPGGCPHQMNRDRVAA